MSGALPAPLYQNLSRPRLSSTSAFTGSEHCHTAGRQVNHSVVCASFGDLLVLPLIPSDHLRLGFARACRGSRIVRGRPRHEWPIGW